MVCYRKKGIEYRLSDMKLKETDEGKDGWRNLCSCKQKGPKTELICKKDIPTMLKNC